MGHSTYLGILIASVIISLALSVFFWNRHPAPGARAMSALAVAIVMASAGYIVELNAKTLADFRIATDIEYAGLVTGPVFWFLFTAQYTRFENWLTRHSVFLFIIPGIILALVWTNPLHNLMWHGSYLETYGEFLVRIKTYGPGFLAHAVYSYGLIFAGLAMLVIRLFSSVALFRNQVIILLSAAILPLVWNIIYVFRAPPTYFIDMTPPAFMVSATVIALGLFRFRFMDVIPVARDKVVETMLDSVIVLDRQNRFLDLNRAAERMIGSPASKLVGKSASVWFSREPELEAYLNNHVGTQSPIIYPSNGTGRYYDLCLLPLYDSSQNLTGRLLILRDITERKKIEDELRLLSHRIINLQDEERASISRELHDEIGQELTLLGLMLSQVKIEIAGQVANARLEEARDQLRKTLASVRAIAVNLYPSMLQTIGLVPTLTWYVDDLSKRIGLKIDFDHSGLQDKTLPDQVNLAVYRIIQEAFTNIIRHSEAKQASIVVKADDKILRLEVEDKGKGFNTAALPGSSIGLRGMRERTRSLGGSLKVESSPGTGTRIIAELPLSSGSHVNSSGEERPNND